MIREHEAALYTDTWQSVSHYGDKSPGEWYLPIFLDLIGTDRGTVLDAGTGSGKGARALRDAGLTVMGCDLTDAGFDHTLGIPFRSACLWHDLTPVMHDARVALGWPWNRLKFDWCYCCDVLEHLPEQFTMLAIDQLLRVARRGVFLGISTEPDLNGWWVGEPLHKTVKPFTWWRDGLRELGTVVEARDLLAQGTFLVTRP